MNKGCGKRLGYMGNYDIHCGINYLDGVKTENLDRTEYCKLCVNDAKDGSK